MALGTKSVLDSAGLAFTALVWDDGTAKITPTSYVPDGYNVTLGALADTAWNGSAGTASLIAIQKAIYGKVAGTLAISAASLPLPTGAATSAKQDTLAALFPASLGAKLGSASLSIVPASDGLFVVAGATSSAAASASNPFPTSLTNGTTALTISNSALGDAFSNAGSGRILVQNYGMSYNGSTWDRNRNNQDTAALVTLSAAAAGTTNSADQTNYNGRGVIAVVNISAITTATAVVKIQGKDAASGQYYDLLTSTGLTATGATALTVYPGAAATANVSLPSPLPKTWRVSVTVTGGSASVTATVGASVIL